MRKQKGTFQIVLLLIVLLIAASILIACRYSKQSAGGSTVSPVGIAKSYTPNPTSSSPSLSPAPSPTAISTTPPKSTEPLPAIGLWTMDSDTSVEFLVTSPSGEQEGYLQASDSYVNTLPDASYGIEKGIGDPGGQGSSLPDHLSFSVRNPKNGRYVLQVIGKKPGKYNIRVTFSWDTGLDVESKEASIDGTLAVNQADKYIVMIPSGTIQKVGK